ncbi:MAG: hypothetical protein AAF403_02660 [Pseudomonadota bacterium]
MSDSERLIRYRQNALQEYDVTDVLLTANLRFDDGTCTRNDDLIKLTFPLIIEAEQGPAKKPLQTTNVEIFIAVLNQQKQILRRDSITIPIIFEPLIAYQDVRHELNYTFKQVEPEIDDHLIYLGFQLTKEELKRIRDQKN